VGPFELEIASDLVDAKPLHSSPDEEAKVFEEILNFLFGLP